MAIYQNILYERQRGGVLITLNRPDRLNTINPEMNAEFHAALDEAEADPAIRAIVVTGAGRAFSAGFDMSGSVGSREFGWPSGLPKGMGVAEYLDNTRKGDSNTIKKLMHIWELSKPVIAAVNGWCMGGASWYALSSHMTFASEQAVFGQPEARHTGNTNFIWVLLAGPKNALRYSLTGDHVDAQEALRIGLVNAVVPHDQLIPTCLDLVERISHVSPETVKANLQVATQGLYMMGLRNAWQLNAELSAIAHTSQREEYTRALNDVLEAGSLRSYLQARDGPFQPEPFGPRSKKP